MMQCLSLTTGNEGDYSEEPARLRNTGFSLCVGCGAAITDQFILRVQPDQEWHARCLKCVKCDQHLDERSTCFVREGRTYCRDDYRKLFILRCTRCCQAFARSDYVMKAKNKTYHMECFRCIICHRMLQTGEEFALRDDGLFCMNDHDKAPPKSTPAATEPDSASGGGGGGGDGGELQLMNQTTASESSLVGDALALAGIGSSPDEKSASCGCLPGPQGGQDSSGEFANNNNNNNNSVKTPSLSDDRMQDSPNSLSDGSQDESSICGEQSMSGEAGSTNGGATGGSLSIGDGPLGGGGGKKMGGGSKRSKEQKTTRVRTVLNEKQLHTLRTCYGANPRPDALMKEQLVEMTGLSPRVIRVWFQNKRCKDKKRQILMKQMEHQQQNGGLQRQLQGIPMVASSPIRNDSSISGATPLEIQQFQGPWKTDFAPLGPEIPSDQPPAFQQLMNTFEVGPESGYFGPRVGGGSKLSLHLPTSTPSGGNGGPPEFLHEDFRPTLTPAGAFLPACPSPHYPVSPCGGILAVGSYGRT